MANAGSAVAEPGWLTARRERAAITRGSLPLPDADVPGWEFTSLAGLDLEAFPPLEDGAGGDEPAHSDVFAVPAGSAHLRQVDGRTSAVEGELPDGVIVATLSEAVREHAGLVERHLGSVVSGDDVFVAHNDAAWTGGLFVYVPPHTRLEAPVLATAVQGAENATLPWRALIVLEEGAQAEVWEQYLGSHDGLFNAVVELVVGPAANLRYVCAQGLDENAWIFGSQRAEVDRDAHLEWVVLGFGSGRGKLRTEAKLAGRGSTAKVTGAYATRGRQHIDFDTTQEHAAQDTVSDLAFRGLLDGRSTAVWRGMIKVDPGAQKTDAFQESRNLLLSKRAHADAIPGLEIQADDVRCTHAAAIAQIDREQLFYLRARGLREAVARRLVIEGFLQELVERFPEGALHDALSGALERRLEQVLSPRGGS
ncbi:MAG TPA: Fe-S cluster assembly protein SufD [Solirubrobacteraceae bacterium]|nr:Fe-S cluster assembly protein SufD [Solirubrobacteraceae bacterium]